MKTKTNRYTKGEINISDERKKKNSSEDSPPNLTSRDKIVASTVNNKYRKQKTCCDAENIKNVTTSEKKITGL